MIKYFVRTTGERKLDKSFSQIDYELLIDKEHKPIESFIKQLSIISEYDAVLLEDDVELCEDFQKEIEKVINEHPKDIINFYSEPMKYYTSHYTQIVIYNQCTYYPKGIGKILSNQMKKELEGKDIREYDILETRAIKTLNLYLYNYRPCLVQHIDNISLMRGKIYISDRITPFFKNYLDKYNVDYTDPKSVFENIDKLKEEKEKFVKKIRKD